MTKSNLEHKTDDSHLHKTISVIFNPDDVKELNAITRRYDLTYSKVIRLFFRFCCDMHKKELDERAQSQKKTDEVSSTAEEQP